MKCARFLASMGLAVILGLLWQFGVGGQEELAARINPKAGVAKNASLLHAGQSNDDWKAVLAESLPLLGHRNWIVVADSAYPLQTAPGIKTIYAGGDHLEAIDHTLKAIDNARHVQGIIHIDSELEFVPKEHAAGIVEFRSGLNPMLKNREVKQLNHEEIIKQLDEAGKTFEVLLIKTDFTLPYTSVFIRLDAGYWSAEAEEALRKAMSDSKK